MSTRNAGLIHHAGQWDQFEARQWLSAIADLGLHWMHLDRDEQCLVSLLLMQNGAIMTEMESQRKWT